MKKYKNIVRISDKRILPPPLLNQSLLPTEHTNDQKRAKPPNNNAGFALQVIFLQENLRRGFLFCMSELLYPCLIDENNYFFHGFARLTMQSLLNYKGTCNFSRPIKNIQFSSLCKHHSISPNSTVPNTYAAWHFLRSQYAGSCP